MRLGKIGEARLPLEVVLGRTESTVADIASIRAGTIIELDSLAGEPVELRAAGQLIGKGEVVVIDEAFGIRVTSIADDRFGQADNEVQGDDDGRE